MLRLDAIATAFGIRCLFVVRALSVFVITTFPVCCLSCCVFVCFSFCLWTSTGRRWRRAACLTGSRTPPSGCCTRARFCRRRAPRTRDQRVSRVSAAPTTHSLRVRGKVFATCPRAGGMSCRFHVETKPEDEIKCFKSCFLAGTEENHEVWRCTPVRINSAFLIGVL